VTANFTMEPRSAENVGRGVVYAGPDSFKTDLLETIQRRAFSLNLFGT